MIPLTQEEQNALVLCAAEALSNFQPGEDAIAVLSRIYCQYLPDKSPLQGELMATELVTWMCRFREGYDAARTNPAGFARFTLMRELQEQPLEEQCRTLHLLLCREKGQISGSFPGPASPKTRDALLEELVGLLTVPTELPSVSGDDGGLRGRVKWHCGEDMTLAATAMMLYTMAKKGALSGVPRDITLSQAALLVCTNDAQCQLVWSEANAYMTRAQVSRLNESLSVTFKVLWLATAIPAVLSGFVVEGALAVTASGLVTLGIMAVLTVYAFRTIHNILAAHADLVANVPLNLQDFRSVPMEQTPHTASAPVHPAAAAGKPEILEDTDDDILSQQF